MLTLNQSDFGRGQASWYEYSGHKNAPTLSFLGANGHAIATYDFFTRQLCEHFNCYALDNRAVWSQQIAPSNRDNWECYLQDYLSFLDFVNPEQGKIIHIGHSLGASLGLLAALRQPQRFSHLILIEPGTTPNWPMHLVYKMISQKGRANIGFIKSTFNRRAQWSSEQEFIREMLTKSTYANFSADAIRDYARGGLQFVDGQYQLRFPPKWESHIFTDIRYVWPMILRLKVPTLVLRAEKSHYVSNTIFRFYEKIAGRTKTPVNFQNIPDAGHLVIQEKPDQVLTTINRWLDVA